MCLLVETARASAGRFSPSWGRARPEGSCLRLVKESAGRVYRHERVRQKGERIMDAAWRACITLLSDRTYAREANVKGPG